MDWHCDGFRLFDGRLEVGISGAGQISLLISQLVPAPTDASTPASASWFDLILVSFFRLVGSAPAAAPASTCKSAAQAPAPVSAPAPPPRPSLATISIWFWAHGFVPQRRHKLHWICSIAGSMLSRCGFLKVKHNLVPLLLSLGESAAGAQAPTSAIASGAFSAS